MALIDDISAGFLGQICYGSDRSEKEPRSVLRFVDFTVVRQQNRVPRLIYAECVHSLGSFMESRTARLSPSWPSFADFCMLQMRERNSGC